MVFTKKTLSSQNSSDTRFSLYNHTLFLTQIKYSHDAEKIRTRFNKISSRIRFKLNVLLMTFKAKEFKLNELFFKAMNLK